MCRSRISGLRPRLITRQQALFFLGPISNQSRECDLQRAGGVAHDFSNLLTAMNGYGDFLLDRPDLKVSCISGYSKDAVRQRIEEGKKGHFLTKPFSLKHLAGAVMDVLHPL